MSQTAIAYLATGLSFLIVDLIWLNVVAKKMYFGSLSHLLAEHYHLWAAGVFYVLYIFGILYFAVMPALRSGNMQSAVMQGAIFGFFCYMTYEFTNYALLKDWPIKLLFVDTAWGTFLTGFAAWAGYLAASRMVG